MTTVNISGISTSQLLDDYRLSLEAMNRSKKTIAWYLEILDKYFTFLSLNSLLKPIDQMGSQELKAYILYLQNVHRWANCQHIRKITGKLSPHSIQGHVRAIKAFWSWLKKEGYIANNALALFPLPRAPDKPMNVFSLEQIRKLLTCIDRLTPRGVKYYTIILLLLDTGIRISELVHLKLEDLDLPHNCLRVMGKGQKHRVVPVSYLTRREITRYLTNIRPGLCSFQSPYLFPTPMGTPISINSVQQALRRLAKTAGLKGIRCSPHTFRHTFATLSIVRGANLFVLKEILGHSSLVTTMRYSHLQPEDIQVQHSKFSPVAFTFGMNLPETT